MNEEEWYLLAVSEKYQEEMLHERHPQTRYDPLFQSPFLAPEIVKNSKCVRCEETCKHEKVDIYSLYTNPWEYTKIEKSFLYDAVDLGVKIIQNDKDVSYLFRTKL